MLISTTPTIEGHPIKQYLGLVTGEAIVAVSFLKDLFRGTKDIVSGRSAEGEKALRKAKDIALDEMERDAQALGATAIVGVDLDYQDAWSDKVMVTVSGTAVVL